LGIEAFDVYGLTELCGPGVSIECNKHNGLHIWEDHFLVETIDPKTGEVLPDGEEGELVFTALTKRGLPTYGTERGIFQLLKLKSALVVEPIPE
jgi:phenylacetate-CoA ligase